MLLHGRAGSQHCPEGRERRNCALEKSGPLTKCYLARPVVVLVHSSLLRPSSFMWTGLSSIIGRPSQSRSNTTRDQMPQPDRCPEVGHDRGAGGLRGASCLSAHCPACLRNRLSTPDLGELSRQVGDVLPFAVRRIEPHGGRQK